MSHAGHDGVNLAINLDARLATLQFVQIQRKTHVVDGQAVEQVGLFARTDLEQPIPEGWMILEEKPLVWYQKRSEAQEEIEEDIDSFRMTIQTIQSLSPQEKNIYDLLYCSPELLRIESEEDIDLGRWWTNRFLFHEKCEKSYPTGNPAPEKGRPETIEAIYQHSSAIDHSCLNTNAEVRLKPDDPDMTLQVVAKQEIKAGEEVLIHYDWAEFHDMRSGRRNKEAHTVHSELYTNRGFICENCILEGKRSKRAPQHNSLGSEVTPEAGIVATRRRVLLPVSQIAALKKKELEKRGDGTS